MPPAAAAAARPPAGHKAPAIAQRLAFAAFNNSMDREIDTPFRWVGGVVWRWSEVGLEWSWSCLDLELGWSCWRLSAEGGCSGTAAAGHTQHAMPWSIPSLAPQQTAPNPKP